jgi:catechol 2,3-dioxygenase-like lactoylglutathione lyase family enzyme
MSIIFGGIRQLGMVVRSAEQAMKEWGRLGVGPFFMVTFQVDDFWYRGNPSPAPVLTLCFAHSGPLQIELIQQHNDVPSAYREFLGEGRQGAQHVCAWYADHDSFDAKTRDLHARGFTLVQQGASRAADARFAYFETGEPGGLMFEISEALMPLGAANRLEMETAAERWDGKQLVAARWDGRPLGQASG